MLWRVTPVDVLDIGRASIFDLSDDVLYQPVIMADPGETHLLLWLLARYVVRGQHAGNFFHSIDDEANLMIDMAVRPPTV